MKKVGNSIYLPNVGKDNYYPNDTQMVNSILEAQASADYPTVASLNYTPTRGSSEGMVPIKNKPNR